LFAAAYERKAKGQDKKKYDAFLSGFAMHGEYLEIIENV
jgi:hypothetical protein